MSKRTSDSIHTTQSLLDEAPLFAGLEGYVIQKHEKPQPAKLKKDSKPKNSNNVVKKEQKTSRQPTSPKTTSGAASPPKKSKKPKVVKPAALEPDAILLSIREMCHLLKISRATLVRMDNAGKIPGKMKLGGSIRFHRATVEAWLESMITAPTTPF